MTRQRFLIIRLSAIGDVLHCTPVARELKMARPDSYITWLTGEASVGLLASNPYIDEVLVWPKERWENALRAGDIREAWHLWQKVRKILSGRSFDIVLDIQGLFYSGLIALLPMAKERIGMKDAREFNYLFMTKTMPGEASPHLIFRYLSVLRGLGIDSKDAQMDLFLPVEAYSFAKQFFHKNGIKQSVPVLVVIPKTTWEGKNWPAKYFAEVINRLGEFYQVVLCGAPGDRAVADEIISQTTVSVADAVGKTSLIELAAVIAKSSLLLTGDTGPLHMAIALNVPTVSLFGASDPKVYGPLSGPHLVLRADTKCAPCNKRNCPRGHISCMPSITPESVIAAINKICQK